MARTPTSIDANTTAYVEAATPKETKVDRDNTNDGEPSLDPLAASSTALVTSASTTIFPTAPEAEAKTDAEDTDVSLRDLYRYASPCDRVLLVVGLLMTVLNGALYPLMAILFGEAISSYQPVNMGKIEQVAWGFFVVAVALFVTDYLAHVCLETTAQKQMHALRIHVFRHVIHKEVAWFECQSKEGPAKLSISQLNSTTMKIKDGMGVKLGEVLRCVTQFLVGYTIGFVKHWQVSIVMASVTPFMVMSLSWIIKILRTRAIYSHQKYAEAGVLAEETLRSIRTVQAFNGVASAVDKYIDKAKSAEGENIKLIRVLSTVLGIFFGTVWVMYAAGLWFGASIVANAGETDPRTIFSAFYGILIGTISLAQISPNVAAVVAAKVVAKSLYEILKQPSKINCEIESDGMVPSKCEGRIVVQNVEFAYPSRPDIPVLREYSLTIRAGETLAFVGPSGGGKSTLMALLQRYYDPDAGQITLDGHRLQDVQLKWLRRQIGIVSQEPVLFATTIFENIASALSDDDDGHMDVAAQVERYRPLVEAAARQAHVHDFIMGLPKGYDTFVGEKGVALSGGQKQRIAIVRALIRDPRILILDEATSALDTESEAQIQSALESILATTSRTTLIIAHRLSTIKRADRICVVVNGEIVEAGTHEELLQKENGKFVELVVKSRVDGTMMIQRNASLMWCDSLTDVLSNGRESSLPMLARSVVDNSAVLESKRSGIMAALMDADENSMGQKKEDADTDLPAPQAPQSSEDEQTLGIAPVIRRLMRYNHQERHLFAIGLLAAALNGLSFPASAILLSAIVSTMVDKYAAFQATQNQKYLDVLYDDIWRLSVVYICGAVALVGITFAQSYAFRYMGEKLVTRLRDVYFRAMCSQEIAYFDDPKHGSGALASDLATKPTQAAVLAGDTPGRIVQVATSFVGALLVSFLMGSWVLSLIMCVVFPLLILADVVRTNTLKGTNTSAKQGEEHAARASALAAEAVTHIRTVASFGLEKRLVDDYRQLSLAPMRQTARVAHSSGASLGFSSFITFAVYALVFWYGATLVRDDRITFTQLIRSLMAVMISASGIGQATSHLTELEDAKVAASSILGMEDRVCAHTIEPLEPAQAAAGAIQFQNVTFAYPSRLNVTVLRRFNLQIEPGQLVAFCGPSGGGKSTVISLLERFYEPLNGTVTLDGVPLHELNICWLRSQIGLIAQEPVLFAGSIHDNIAYGAADSSLVTREQVEQAAKVANAHAFVSAFPDGYDTEVGGQGEQLSGGQKQRIAIARAVLKDPSIMLLDEATSALDADSEQLVQEALEHVIKMKKRTTIVIAHRMRTIRYADKICVLANGEIVEQGTHRDLVQIHGGLYAKLVENSEDLRFSVVE